MLKKSCLFGFCRKRQKSKKSCHFSKILLNLDARRSQKRVATLIFSENARSQKRVATLVATAGPFQNQPEVKNELPLESADYNNFHHAPEIKKEVPLDSATLTLWQLFYGFWRIPQSDSFKQYGISQSRPPPRWRRTTRKPCNISWGLCLWAEGGPKKSFCF